MQYSDALLQEDPFNLRALNAKLLVYAQQNNTEEYKSVARQRRIVQDAIIGTGDGMSDKTPPFYVIKMAHEYDILPFGIQLRWGRQNYEREQSQLSLCRRESFRGGKGIF